MRWTEALNELPVETRARLINGLSIGFGWAALASRRASRDADVESVQSAVAAAHDALGQSLQLLPHFLQIAAVQVVLLQVSRSISSPNWQVYLDGQADDEKARIQGLLVSALGQTTRAALAVRTDATGEIVVAEIVSAQAALRLLHARLGGAGGSGLLA